MKEFFVKLGGFFSGLLLPPLVIFGFVLIFYIPMSPISDSNTKELCYYTTIQDIMPNTDISCGEGVYYVALPDDTPPKNALTEGSMVLKQDVAKTKRFIPKGVTLQYNMIDNGKEVIINE